MNGLLAKNTQEGRLTKNDGNCLHYSIEEFERQRKQLIKLQRKLAKMQEGSNRYLKQQCRIARLHNRIVYTITNYNHIHPKTTGSFCLH
ncbi:hypothetical protein RO575_22625 [Methylomonas sp. MO1]|uniref:hypothetical protein n=1 Tax=Methylomonas sp. MO1 TaxID=3073619 RepID=UPI0028A5000B|nr:hypothetical protein [Methylomonas sp. MO1]MDT4292371.1 hypothetical protein [Methylomonas sp. MO1]